MFMRALESHGHYFLSSEDNEPTFDENLKFCETRNILVISKMTNFFIAEHFP
jgi:hypothetical protein